MIWHRSRLLALVCACVAVVPQSVSAQQHPVMIEAQGDFAAPLTAPTRDRFLPGGGGSVGALFAPYRFVLGVVRARALVFGDGPAPDDPRFADPGIGTLYTLSAGLRIRFDGINQVVPEPEATGFFLELDLGAGLSGSLVRPVFEGALGYLWDLGQTEHADHVDLGPVIHFVHVLQTEEAGIDANSTFLITLGLQIVLYDAAPTIAEQRVIQTIAARHHTPIEGVDTDGDGIDDADDGCPTQAEDLDRVRDLDGCPDEDDDHDHIGDASDECPRDAEDVDGFQDEDGCPESDNDGDGWVDAQDQCPNEAETPNGIDDHDGCPEGSPVEIDPSPQARSSSESTAVDDPFPAAPPPPPMDPRPEDPFPPTAPPAPTEPPLEDGATP